ncbi:hypothetical protein L1987_62883 [Smallanthus sonchifolius]|uniref:Uncharacterized protein n=1 Tax=Smallanthus sonchifolius TaxID=185202 RepID=A0ACB9CBQ7_9ASTR|nr:hypothetical protein L1987_62883 [Smallanthus sonchifolius]
MRSQGINCPSYRFLHGNNQEILNIKKSAEERAMEGFDLDVCLKVQPHISTWIKANAVILEGLRRHPPGHLVLPHRVSDQVELQGYKIPKGATINFMVAEMGWDPDVWDEPMEFKPERFLLNDGSGVGFDVGGSKGIKMMPFGAGRRICPGADLALLHLEYFVANLIWYFHWSVADGYVVDLAEQAKLIEALENEANATFFSCAAFVSN